MEEGGQHTRNIDRRATTHPLRRVPISDGFTSPTKLDFIPQQWTPPLTPGKLRQARLLVVQQGISSGAGSLLVSLQLFTFALICVSDKPK